MHLKFKHRAPIQYEHKEIIHHMVYITASTIVLNYREDRLILANAMNTLFSGWTTHNSYWSGDDCSDFFMADVLIGELSCEAIAAGCMLAQY